MAIKLLQGKDCKKESTCIQRGNEEGECKEMSTMKGSARNGVPGGEKWHKGSAKRT
jgi:hypothetical protein